MDFSLQPRLENENIILEPLLENDFELLYDVAKERKIWLQHPNPDRYKREIFKTFFEGAMLSGGAFKIIDKKSGNVVGSSRFYNYSVTNNNIFIGYTFYGSQYWGTGINHQAKKLMLQYIFQFVDEVTFHVGANNVPSQTSIERLGAKKITEQEVEYFGEMPRLNFVYSIKKSDYN